jgi:hypothetical protein
VPAVSVVIPAYNAADTLREAIDSVLDQTLADWELVVVDDGSTDASGEIARSYTDHRVRVVAQPNRGLAAARNAGIAASGAPLVAFLDADDVYHPDKLARHVAHFRAEPAVGLSFSHSLLVDEAGRSLGKRQTAPAGAVPDAALFLSNPVGNGSAAVARRDALEAIAADGEHGREYFDPRLAAVEDVDAWWRIAWQTPYHLSCLPAALTHYRQRGGAITMDPERMLRGWEAAVEKARQYAPPHVLAHLPAARARLLRYLAGRAVAAGDGAAAWRLLRTALATDRRLALAQPRQVALTAAAATALRILPAPLARAAEHRTRRILDRAHPA